MNNHLGLPLAVRSVIDQNVVVNVLHHCVKGLADNTGHSRGGELVAHDKDERKTFYCVPLFTFSILCF